MNSICIYLITSGAPGFAREPKIYQTKCVLRNREYPLPTGNVFIFYKIEYLFNLYYIVLKPILVDSLQNEINLKFLSLIVVSKKAFK